MLVQKVVRELFIDLVTLKLVDEIKKFQTKPCLSKTLYQRPYVITCTNSKTLLRYKNISWACVCACVTFFIITEHLSTSLLFNSAHAWSATWKTVSCRATNPRLCTNSEVGMLYNSSSNTFIMKFSPPSLGCSPEDQPFIDCSTYSTIFSWNKQQMT